MCNVQNWSILIQKVLSSYEHDVWENNTQKMGQYYFVREIKNRIHNKFRLQ